MKEYRLIPLSGKHGQGKFAIVDESDFETLSKRRWHFTSAGYAARHDHKNGADTLALMHRELMNPGQTQVVDHINGDKLDNRRCNLRICSTSENMWNMKKRRGKSTYRGVWFDTANGKWAANLRKNGVKISLGRFESEEVAARAYDKAAKQHYGEFAATNFED